MIVIMQVVYVIQHSTTGQLYIGQTSNLQQRLDSHNNHRNKSTNRRKGEWILVYAEAYRLKIDANKRESRLKCHGSSKHELVKRISSSLLEVKSEAG